MNELQALKGVLYCLFFRSQSTGGSSSGGGSNAANSTNSSSSSGHGSGHHHDASGSIAAVQSTLERLSSQRDELGELWAARKRRPQLAQLVPLRGEPLQGGLHGGDGAGGVVVVAGSVAG